MSVFRNIVLSQGIKKAEMMQGKKGSAAGSTRGKTKGYKPSSSGQSQEKSGSDSSDWSPKRGKGYK